MEEKETTIEAIKTIHQYSQNFYEEQRNRFDRIDTKSSNLVTFGGIVAGLALFSTQFFFGEAVKNSGQVICYVILLGLYITFILYFLFSILFAIKAYKLRDIHTIPGPTDIIEWYGSEENKDKSNERLLKLFAYRMAQGADSYMKEIDKKAKQIRYSEKLLWWAIVLMIIFIIIFPIIKLSAFK